MVGRSDHIHSPLGVLSVHGGHGRGDLQQYCQVGRIADDVISFFQRRVIFDFDEPEFEPISANAKVNTNVELQSEQPVLLSRTSSLTS